MSRSRLTATILLLVLLVACARPDLSEWLNKDIPTQVTPLPATQTPIVMHSTPRFQVFIVTPLTTCLVGNEFASGNVCAGSECGDCSCSWEQHDPPAPQVGVQPEKIDELPYSTYAHKVCLDITLTPEEIREIIDDMNKVKDLVYEWTGGALDLQMEYTVLPHTFTGFTAPEFVIGPFEIDDDLLDAYVSTETDFVYVVSGYRDYEQGLQLAAWCGSSYGEYSIRGSTYSYVQFNQEACNSVTIGGEVIFEALIHEWMHSLDWALYYVNDVPDIYQDVGPDWGAWEHASWPACGTGSPDPLDWFPSIDFCEWDPDWIDCNNSASAGACLHAGEVEGAVSWYEHVIREHYPREVLFNGNYCTNGRQDFTETGIDSGWPCP